jgi:hypothetical protein
MSGSERGLGAGRVLWWAICAIALIQTGLGLAVLALDLPWVAPTRLVDWQRAAAIVALSGLAAYLLLGLRRDSRVEHLGTVFLLLAVFFAHPPARAWAEAHPDSLGGGLRFLTRITIDALTPVFLWLFARDFPRTLEWRRTARFVSAVIALSATAALALIAANLAISLDIGSDALSRVSRTSDVSLYWTLVFGLLAPALPFMVWRGRHAPEAERRRVRLFVAGVAAGAVMPVSIAVLPPLWPAFQELVRANQPWILPINLLSILSVAATTTYAVAVNNVLDLRTVLRKAAQYGLARGMVALLAAIPFGIVVSILYGARREPLQDLFVGTRPFELALMLAAGLAVLRLRARVMGTIDRLFFREAYDAHRILADVAERSRAARSTMQLAESLTTEVDRALHLESIGLLIESPAQEAYVPLSGSLRRLPAHSALASRLAGAGGPGPVDLDRPRPPLEGLPEEDRIWIADSGAEVMVAIPGSDGALLGILSLGPKRSELPFSREDLSLLSALGNAAGVGLENRLLRESAGSLRGDEEERNVSECVACGHIETLEASACSECGAGTRGGRLPRTLFGKFRLEQRIGVGSMGVVYRAHDVTLDRTVALKTLPATSPEDANRLRREARAMAAITHPNLALIFGIETWHGTPVLVMEHLDGGTLEERLAAAPLAPKDALDLIGLLADVLARAHASGLLHRDVKPSNVGFTSEHTPKLLDFGLVRLVGEAAPPTTALEPAMMESAATETGIVGTPLYMSPEALAGERPDVGFDLWSLAVVAFEALAGRHPFERATGAATLDAIRKSDLPDLRTLVPGCPDELVELLTEGLANEPSRRPGSAREFADRVRAAREAISA